MTELNGLMDIQNVTISFLILGHEVWVIISLLLGTFIQGFFLEQLPYLKAKLSVVVPYIEPLRVFAGGTNQRILFEYILLNKAHLPLQRWL